MTDMTQTENQLAEIKKLLAKQKVVEGLVHRQDMPRHELVESMVQKQNLVDLQKFLEKLSNKEIANALEVLSENERNLVWDLVADHRKDEVLVDVSDDVRVDLVSESKPPLQSTVLRVFDLHEGRLRQIPIYSREDLAKAKPIWVDLVTPEDEELKWAREVFGVQIPNPKDLTDLETSARFYVEDNGEVHLHSDFLLDLSDESRSITVAFVLTGNTLFSVRNEELPVFRLQRLRARAQAGYVSEAKDVLLDLYAADVEYSANALEDIYSSLAKVGKQVFKSHITNNQAAKILTAISEEEDINGRIRRNVLDTRNALSFLMRGRLLSSAQHDDVREILRDIESLDGHTSFLFNKINFQMDATVGFLNVNQNIDLKRLTIISVVFMPVNILAGIGGMSEFSMMTAGIPWPIAYGSFIVVMVMIGILTFLGLRTFENRKIKNLRSETLD
ncbi:MAG: CorA family divalent cation transporter [Methylophilaceae bacterium]|jgi:magnesium transporter